MSDQNNNVAMFAVVDGERKQVGWASPAVDGVRKTEKLPGFENVNMSDVSFEDDDVAEEDETVDAENTEEHEDDSNENYPQAGDEGKDSAPIQLENNETVELNAGGGITEIDEEEAEFQRELEAEEARFAEDAKQAPQTRREARENEENE